MHLEVIVARQSVSDHHCHSVWQGEAGSGGVGGGGGVRRYSGAYRHHLIIGNTLSLSFPALSPTHSCRAFKDPRKLFGSLQPGTPSYSLTLPLYALPARTALSHELPSNAKWAFPHSDQVNLEMYFEAMIERLWRYTLRPRSTELRDAIGGRDRMNSEMQMEAMTKWTQRCNSRPWSSEFGDALEGHNQGSVEMHSAMIDWDWRSTWRQSIWRRWIRKVARRELRLYSLRNSSLWECRKLSTTRCAERWEMRLAGCRRQSIMEWCCTKCMLYLVLTNDHGMQR